MAIKIAYNGTLECTPRSFAAASTLSPPVERLRAVSPVCLTDDADRQCNDEPGRLEIASDRPSRRFREGRVTHMTQKTLTAPAGMTMAAQKTLAHPIDIEMFMSKLGAKDRANAEKHLAACDAEGDPRHGLLWRRLACALKTLAPHATKVNGRESVQFYVPDGKYKLQVFALHDARDGKLYLYTGNVLKEACKAGVLVAPKGTAAKGFYTVPKSPDLLQIEELDENTPEPAPFFKHMLGWSRKAIRIILPTTSAESHILAAEHICVISAAAFAPAT